MLPVFFDTCVLLKPYLCDTILTVAESGIYRQVGHRLDQMTRHFPDAEITDYEQLIDSMTNDPKDRHVLAAAVRAGAEVLVTENLKDFPEPAAAPYGVTVLHQDEFLLDQLDLAPEVMHEALRRQVSRYRRAPRSVDDLLDVLGNEGHGCPGFAEACRGERWPSPWKP